MNGEGDALSVILATLNNISERRDRYEPFLDQIERQWGGVSFSLSRVLILLARQQLQNCMFARMLDWYEAAIGLPHNAVKYRIHLKPPLAGMTAPDFARSCLSTALQLDPENMYAALLMGMALEEAGELTAAASWYEKSSRMRGLIGGVGHWLAARAFEKSGDFNAASCAYAAAEKAQGHWRQIELVHLARMRAKERNDQEALELAGEAAQYKWQSLIELFFDLPTRPDPVAIEVAAPFPYTIDLPVLDPITKRGCTIYGWNDRYYAVPASLGPVRPIDLTREGIDRGGTFGWRMKLIFIFHNLPRCYLFLKPLMSRLPVLAGLCHQFERSLIRSAASLNALAEGRGEPVATSPAVGFIDRDGYEYRILRDQGMYVAVPVLYQGYNWHHNLTADLSRWKRLVIALTRHSPTMLKVGYLFMPTRVNALRQKIFKERIISGFSLGELERRFHFRETSRP